MKKRIALMIMLTVAAGAFAAFAAHAMLRHVAEAAEAEPTKMAMEDAARLDAAMAHAAPYLAQAGAICARYKFGLLPLLVGQVSVDYASGEIHRAQAAPAAKEKK